MFVCHVQALRAAEHRRLVAEKPRGAPPLSAEERAAYTACVRVAEHAVVINKFNIEVTGRHIHRLLPGGWLSDEIVNFYMELLADRARNNPALPRCHFFNSHFYSLLSKEGHGYDYPRVRRWTNKVDIFAVDKVVVPVHLGMHWCLAMLNMSAQRLEYYDSMGGTNPECLAILRRYLQDEHQHRKGTPLDLSTWSTYTPGRHVPQQEGGYDCGVFACLFARACSANEQFAFSQATMPGYRQSMVLEILRATLR